MKEMLSIAAAARLVGVHPGTLRRWELEGRITSQRINARGDRRFAAVELEALLRAMSGESEEDHPTQAASYVRVSGRGDQLSSLQEQAAELELTAEERGLELVAAFSDVGSGLSERRRGLTQLLAAAARGEFDVVLVTHEDRLARFGTPWLRQLLELHGVSVVVLHEKGSGSAEAELVADFVALVASFSGRLYGQRSASAKRRLLERAGAGGSAQ